MEDSEKIKQRFELLKMARELLNEDYINRRAEDHNKWVAENEEMWRTSRRNVPYPPFTQYPTDDEIVKAASNLYNFIYSTTENSAINTEQTIVQHSEPITTPDEKKLPTTVPQPPEADIVVPENADADNSVAELPEIRPHSVTHTFSTSSPAYTSEEIQALKDSMLSTDTLSARLLADELHAEEAKRNVSFNVKKMLPGWVRRTTDTHTGSDNP